MEVGEYLLALLAIITGLAITEMIASLHGLLLNRRSVKWDWLAPMISVLIFIMIVASWGISFRAFSRETVSPPLWYFILTLGSVIPFYLAARAALPDRVQVGDVVDLAAHYRLTSRYIWSAIFTSNFIYYVVVVHDIGLAKFAAALPRMWPNLLGVFLIIPLMVWPDRRLHRLLVPVLFIFVCVSVLPKPMMG